MQQRWEQERKAQVVMSNTLNGPVARTPRSLRSLDAGPGGSSPRASGRRRDRGDVGMAAAPSPGMTPSYESEVSNARRDESVREWLLWSSRGIVLEIVARRD